MATDGKLDTISNSRVQRALISLPITTWEAVIWVVSISSRVCLSLSPLILDEPTSGLDPRTRFEFKEILSELQESGKTIVISSHVLSELSELCTDIGIIDQGRMVLEGNINDILSRVNTSNPLVISVFSNVDKALAILKSHPCVQTISLREQDICVRFSGDSQDEALLLQQLIDSDVLGQRVYQGKGKPGIRVHAADGT